MVATLFLRMSMDSACGCCGLDPFPLFPEELNKNKGEDQNGQ